MITDSEFYAIVNDTYADCISQNSEEWEDDFMAQLEDKIAAKSPFLRVRSFIFDSDCDSVSDLLYFFKGCITMREGGEVLCLSFVETAYGYVVSVLKRL